MTVLSTISNGGTGADIRETLNDALARAAALRTETLAGGGSVIVGAVPATFVAFAASACTAMLIENTGNVQIEYQRLGAGAAMFILPRQKRWIFGITDASQIAFRRSDFATARTTQLTTVRASYYNIVGPAYAAPVIGQVTFSGGGKTAGPNIPCTAVEIVNGDMSAIEVRVGANNATSVVRIHSRDSVIVSGITNTNQVFFNVATSVGGSTASIEAFQGVPHRPPAFYGRNELLSDNVKIFLEEPYMNGWEHTIFATPAMLSSFKRVTKPGSQLITRFDVAANATSPAAAILTDVAAGKTKFNFNGLTRLRATTTSANGLTFLSTMNAARGVNTQAGNKGTIHIDLYTSQRDFSHQVSVDLFSAGTPSAPAANYHTVNLNPNYGSVYVDHALGSYGMPIGMFAAVGTGADLTSILYARVRTSGTIAAGDIVEVGDIKFVPNQDAKAKVIFTWDDCWRSPMTLGLPIMSRYNYPSMLFPSPVANRIAVDPFLTPDDMMMLQNNYGWQIAAQDYASDGSRDLTPEEYLETQSKVFYLGAAMGCDIDGLRDSSYYGGYTYAITQEQVRQGAKLFASYRQFNNGLGTATDASIPLPRPVTWPMANPYGYNSINMTSYGTTDAAGIATKYQAHVDQAIAHGGVAVFAAHDDLSTPAIYTAFVQLIEYIRTQELAGKCEVVTMKQLRARL